MKYLISFFIGVLLTANLATAENNGSFISKETKARAAGIGTKLVAAIAIRQIANRPGILPPSLFSLMLSLVNHDQNNIVSKAKENVIIPTGLIMSLRMIANLKAWTDPNALVTNLITTVKDAAMIASGAVLGVAANHLGDYVNNKVLQYYETKNLTEPAAK